MSISDYKTSLKQLIDATDDEPTLQRWQALLQKDLEQHQQRTSPSGDETANEENKEDTSGYAVLESGLGIDE